MTKKKSVLQSFALVFISSYLSWCPVSVWASQCLLPPENTDADIFCQPSLPAAISWNMPLLAAGYRLPPASWGLVADGSKPQSLVLDSVLELNVVSWCQEWGFYWIFFSLCYTFYWSCANLELSSPLARSSGEILQEVTRNWGKIISKPNESQK